MFIPRKTIVGSGFAAILMVGAVGSHVIGPVGMEGHMGTMMILASIALLAAIIATAVAIKRKSPSPL
ncbi:MAG: hypothetical protein ED559_08715 [Phycisphaera sp.]|nr:MAG: hypothetical protein ED559_08715 [Phycisphaera sp.]